MNGTNRDQGGIGWIILLLVLLYIIFNPIPGPIDDVTVAAIAGSSVSAISRPDGRASVTLWTLPSGMQKGRGSLSWTRTASSIPRH